MNHKVGYAAAFALGAIFAFSTTYTIMDNANKLEREELVRLKKAMLEQQGGIHIPNPFAGMGAGLDKLKKQMQDMMEEEQKRQEEQDTLFGSIADSIGNIGSAFDVGKVERREDENFYYYDLEVGSSENNKINVNIEDSQLILSGTIEKINNEGSFKSSFSSSFNKSFPVPADGDAQKMSVDQNAKEGFLVIKIPKKK